MTAGLGYRSVQNNQSSSCKRGPCGLCFKEHILKKTGKGAIRQCACLRKDSETYGEWAGMILSVENYCHFMISRRFAYDFVVLFDNAEITYMYDEKY